MGEPKPLPCPFCNEPEHMQVQWEDRRPYEYCFVRCLKCDARGPESETSEEAIAAWNRRAPVEWTVTAKEANDFALGWIRDHAQGRPDLAHKKVEALGGKVEG